jgi:vancomycin aglycone glucosyltransferase
LNDPDAQSWKRAVRPADQHPPDVVDLPRVDDVRELMFTSHPWLAADRTLSPWREPADLAVVRTAA